MVNSFFDTKSVLTKSFYLLISSLIIVFSESLVARVPIFNTDIDFKLAYILLPLNFAIIVFSMRRINIPKNFIFTLLFVGLYSLYFALNSKNTIIGIFSNLLGISLFYLYFLNLIGSNKRFNDLIFNAYISFTKVIVLIGYAIYFYEILKSNYDYRFHSIMLEPAHYAGIILPFLVFKIYKDEFFSLSFLAALLSLILSLSFVGIFCLVIMMFFKLNKNNFLITASFIFIIPSIFVLAYLFIPGVAMRVDGLLLNFVNFEVADSGLSAYAFFSNLYVAIQVLQESPLLGYGIGSHELSHSRFINNLPGIDIIDEDWVSINSKDANSLFIRILSDMGLFGVILLFLIFKNIFFINKKEDKPIIYGAFSFFVYKLIREGHYFSPEMYFFYVIFLSKTTR